MAEEEAPKPDSGEPRKFSEEERIKKSRVVEDVDIFDEVFEGKKEKHVEAEETNAVEAKGKAEEEKKDAGEKGNAEKKEDEEEKEPEEEKTEKAEKKQGEQAEKEEKASEEKTKESEAEEEPAEEKTEESEAKEEAAEEKETESKEESRKGKKKIDFKKEDVNQKEVKAPKKRAEDEIADEFEEMPSREEIKRKILEKAVNAQKPVEGGEGLPLSFLEDKESNAFIGRKRSVQEKYGTEGALYLGGLREEGTGEKKIFLDSLNPHVVFVCGARGSGKSYVLGVIAEEIAKKNPNLGSIVIDPIGVFWSMRFPNREDRELDALPRWGLMPEGLENLKVFIPEGMRSSVPSSTFDATFSIQPSLLTAEDWCLTFGMERFGPTGLLLDKLLKRVEHGYKKKGQYVKGKKKTYSLNDLIECLETDEELNSREHGFKQDSIRALTSRFEAAKTWGIFSEKGTPLSELSRENQLTVLDTSFLEDNVTALVIGVLARRILAARKLSTRKEAAKRFKEMDVEGLLEGEIPPTWLFIDEAHTLIPSGNVTTPATNALIEYVKQGRRPGCSIVFATQQPSAIDTKVLSQLDILMTHKLVFDDDIKAIFKRIPTIIPHKYKKSNFIRTLPIGTALVGDRREETSRAFVMKIRPRVSQHEGREAEARREKVELSRAQVEKLALNMLLQDLERNGMVEMATVNQVIDTLNSKYKEKVMLSTILDLLEKKGTRISADKIVVPGMEKPAEAVEETKETEPAAEGIPEAAKEVTVEQLGEETELMAFPVKFSEEDARRIANKNRKRKFLGLLGSEERIEEIQLRYQIIWRVDFNEFTSKNEYVLRTCYVNSMTGEMVHFKGNEFIESSGFKRIAGLKRDEVEALKEIREKKRLPASLSDGTAGNEKKVKKLLDSLVEKEFLEARKEENKVRYVLSKGVDLPPGTGHSLLSSLNSLPIAETPAVSREMALHSKEETSRSVTNYFPNTVVKKVSEVYRPVYEVVLQKPDGTHRGMRIDGFTGKVLG